MKKSFFIFLLSVSLVSILSSCDKTPKEEPIGTCPCNTDILYWRDHAGYGMWRCGYTYIDGNIGIATGGAVAMNILSDCPWKIYGDNAGGVGHIYQVIPADTSIRFTWENNSLHQIEVFYNWNGHTENGSQINETIEHFLQRESGFSVTADSMVYVYKNSTVSITAEFTDKIITVGKLRKLHLHSLLWNYFIFGSLYTGTQFVKKKSRC